MFFLLYTLFINICTFFVSCARGVTAIHFAEMTVSYRLKYMGVGFVFGLGFIGISLLSKHVAYSPKPRNYELDFLKFVFTLCVFISHTVIFRDENTNFILPLQFGHISVLFFFMVSGMLMTNSILKKEINTNRYGKLAIQFVINKIKMLAGDVYAALLVFMVIYLFIIPSERVIGELVKIVPELFFVTRAGISFTYNAPVWYLSAMLLGMLPMAYLLYRNEDFTRHILAPLLSVFTLGWICQTNNYCFPEQDKMHGLFLGGMYSAISGLCFGMCAYNIYIYLRSLNMGRNGRKFLTIIEVFLYGVFWGTCFWLRNNRMMMSVILLLPIAIAITFSRKSYIVRLFQYDWMKYFAPISLAIYLNHWIGRVLVHKYFEGSSYGFCVFMMAVFTLGSCLLSTCIKKVGKYMWNNKLKTMLFNYE